MSRSDRRRAKQNVKNFVPKKSNALDKRVIVLLAIIVSQRSQKSKAKRQKIRSKEVKRAG